MLPFIKEIKAYYEATPQNLLSQARFISKDLFELVIELFNKDTLSHIRIVQGFIRTATKHHLQCKDKKPEMANHIAKAVATMRAYNRYRVAYFDELLKQYRREILAVEDREIRRRPGNPMLRYQQPDLPKREVINQGENPWAQPNPKTSC